MEEERIESNVKMESKFFQSDTTVNHYNFSNTSQNDNASDSGNSSMSNPSPSEHIKESQDDVREEPPLPPLPDEPPALPPRPPNLALQRHHVPPPHAPREQLLPQPHALPECATPCKSWWSVLTRKYVVLSWVSGGLCVLLGVLFLVLHFMVVSRTSSLQYFQTIPAYVPAIVMICTGILVTVFSKGGARYPSLIKITGCCCLVSSALCVVVTITTTVIHMNRLQTLRECVYQTSTKTCTCFAGILDPRSIEHEATVRYVFTGTSDCEVVHGTLYSCLRGMFGLSVIGILVSIFSCMLVYQILSHERKKKYLQQLDSQCRSMYCRPGLSRSVQSYCSTESSCQCSRQQMDYLNYRLWGRRCDNLYSPTPANTLSTRTGTPSSFQGRTASHWRVSNPDDVYGFRPGGGLGTSRQVSSCYTVTDLLRKGILGTSHLHGNESLPNLLWGPPPPYTSVSQNQENPAPSIPSSTLSPAATPASSVMTPAATPASSVMTPAPMSAAPTPCSSLYSQILPAQVSSLEQLLNPNQTQQRTNSPLSNTSDLRTNRSGTSYPDLRGNPSGAANASSRTDRSGTNNPDAKANRSGTIGSEARTDRSGINNPDNRMIRAVTREADTFSDRSGTVDGMSSQSGSKLTDPTSQSGLPEGLQLSDHQTKVEGEVHTYQMVSELGLTSASVEDEVGRKTEAEDRHVYQGLLRRREEDQHEADLIEIRKALESLSQGSLRYKPYQHYRLPMDILEDRAGGYRKPGRGQDPPAGQFQVTADLHPGQRPHRANFGSIPEATEVLRSQPPTVLSSRFGPLHGALVDEAGVEAAHQPPDQPPGRISDQITPDTVNLAGLRGCVESSPLPRYQSPDLSSPRSPTQQASALVSPSRMIQGFLPNKILPGFVGLPNVAPISAAKPSSGFQSQPNLIGLPRLSQVSTYAVQESLHHQPMRKSGKPFSKPIKSSSQINALVSPTRIPVNRMTESLDTPLSLVSSQDNLNDKPARNQGKVNRLPLELLPNPKSVVSASVSSSSSLFSPIHKPEPTTQPELSAFKPICFPSAGQENRAESDPSRQTQPAENRSHSSEGRDCVYLRPEQNIPDSFSSTKFKPIAESDGDVEKKQDQYTSSDDIVLTLRSVQV